jgi:cytochrome b pre-mRNA-processing protein 3
LLTRLTTLRERLSPSRRARAATARKLCDSATAKGRDPALYTRLDAPDTVEGRFEVLTLHVVLLIGRLRAEGGEGAEAGQDLFDAYLSDLDGALREMGVGDLSVGRRMKALAQAFYGRAKGYDEAFAALPDRAPLEAVIARTLLAGASTTDPGPLAAYAARARQALATCQIGDLLAGAAPWPDV